MKNSYFIWLFVAATIILVQETRAEFQIQKKKLGHNLTDVVEIENNVCQPKFCKSSGSNMPLSSPSRVKAFCDLHNGTIEHRCCWNQTDETIIGIDYTSCNLTELSTSVGILNRSLIANVVILDVTNNNLIECGDRSTFAGFLALDQLYLTTAKSKLDFCKCPGGNYSWTSINDSFCLGRKPICHTDFNPNINCTENSECGENGPGNFVCTCKPGYHGYKCLYEGTFPSILFTSIICGVTLFLSAFLWHFERRLVKKHEN